MIDMIDGSSQIKKNLIKRIKSSNDLAFLKAVQTIFDSSSQSLYPLTEEQELSIQKGREDILNGDTYENSDVISEMRTWLKRK